MKHPDSIPGDAYWVGGEDGGIFLTVVRDRRGPDLYFCRVYDMLGELESEGLFSVMAPGAPSLDLTNPHLFSGWDGHILFLSDGRTMVRNKWADVC